MGNDGLYYNLYYCIRQVKKSSNSLRFKKNFDKDAGQTLQGVYREKERSVGASCQNFGMKVRRIWS